MCFMQNKFNSIQFAQIAGWGRTVRHETSDKPSILQYVRVILPFTVYILVFIIVLTSFLIIVAANIERGKV